MKAEIDESGMLIVTAENGLESYALKCWCDQSVNRESKNSKEWFVEKLIVYLDFRNDSNSKESA